MFENMTMKTLSSIPDSYNPAKALEMVSPLISSASAIVPVYYGFLVKSALQLGNPIPKMSTLQKIKEGIKVSPMTSVIVGSQLVFQSAINKMLFKDNMPHSFSRTLLSSAIVAGVSAPLLTMFNGRTVGLSAKQSIRSMSSMQIAAIVLRETSFIFSLKVSGPLKEVMHQKDLKAKPYEIAASFLSGAIGSAIGHPADSALTLWQKGIKIQSAALLSRGLFTKSLAVGGFSVVYNLSEQTIKQCVEKLS